MKTSVSAVATSRRPRRPSSPIPSAPPSENTPRPSSGLTPTRLAPAAPANEPFGTAWATNAEPRMTVKNPTAPPTIATSVATIQAFDHEAGEHRLSSARCRVTSPDPR